MPYIKDRRDILDPRINDLADSLTTDGDLNYAITRLVSRYCALEGNWRYTLIARAVGALECVKLEFYRRLAGPYEDKARDKNGDIAEYQG